MHDLVEITDELGKGRWIDDDDVDMWADDFAPRIPKEHTEYPFNSDEVRLMATLQAQRRRHWGKEALGK